MQEHLHLGVGQICVLKRHVHPGQVLLSGNLAPGSGQTSRISLDLTAAWYI